MQPRSSLQPRVTAILVCANGADLLDRTLDALAAQTRPPENLVVVDIASTDGSTNELSFGGAAQISRIPAGRPFGEAVAHGERLAPRVEPSDDSGEQVEEWLWLIGHDNAPAPTALAELLAAVEIAPSVAVAGPKLMAVEQPTKIEAFGESMTRFGRSMTLVADELDQGQHDNHTDVLAVAAGGMIVRRSVWTALGGFDPALPHVDASLDFCVRARLAGHRVSLVPESRVTTAGPPEDFGRKHLHESRRVRFQRQAQLHRRMTYAPAGLLWLHWLALVPFAVGRSFGHLVSKHPGAVGGEIGAAFAVAFGSGASRSRAVLARNRRVGWAAIEPLRVSWRRVLERRITSRDVEIAHVEDAAVARASFLGDGGLWVVLAAALVSAVVLGSLIGSPALTGGGLLPLSDTVGRLWQNVGYGWHTLGTGFAGASDPFAAVLAVLGTITFWSPSWSVVLVVLLSFPLAALGSWFAVRRVTTRRWVPVVGAALYTLAPPLVTGVMSGHLGAVLAHVFLPWFFLTILGAHRSWASSAGAALLFAVIVAGAPSLIPFMVIAWVVSLVVGWRHAHRRIAIPLPAIVLFAPLAWTQIVRGTPLAILADPGVPSATRAPSALQLAVGSPLPDWNGWATALHGVAGFGGVVTALPIVLAVLALPIGATAVGALLGHRWHLASVALGFAFVGYLTAFAAGHVALTGVGSTTTIIWPGSALSVYWFALVIAAAVGLDTLPRLAPGLGVLAAGLVGVAVAPMFAGMFIGTAAITPTTGRVLSAYVNAEAQANPDVGTLVISPLRDGTLGVSLERGQGSTLDDQSTLDATALDLSPAGRRLTTLAANLASRSGFDPRPDLQRLGVSFILLSDASESGNGVAEALHTRAAGSIGQNALFKSIGDTTNGMLWHYEGRVDRPGNGSATAATTHVIVLIVLGVVFGATALLAIPTAPRRRRAVSNVLEADEPATTFDEERDE